MRGDSKQQASARWRFYLIVVFSSLLPLLLFLYAGHRLLTSNTTKALFRQSELAATTTSSLLEGRIADVIASLRAIASNRSAQDAWARGDSRALADRIEEIHKLRRETGSLAFYDAGGVLLAIYPRPTDGAANGLAFQKWVAAAMRQRAPVISGLLPIAAAPERSGVMVALPLENPSGVLAGIYSLEDVRDWLRGIPESTTKWVHIVDQDGNELLAPGLGSAGPFRNLREQEDVRQVLAGKRGTAIVSWSGDQSLLTRHPLSFSGWGLLVRIPVAEIDKAIWQWEQPIALLGLFFLVLAGVGGMVLAGLHRRLRESEEHIRQIISSSADAFVAIDADGNITEWNSQAETLFGWLRLQAVGQPLHRTIIPERYRESHVQGLERFRASGESHVRNRTLELAALHHDGREFPVELSISHLRKGRKSYFHAFVRDISARKQTEKEVADLNAALRAQVLQLQARNKELEAFSYSVSHDVRAPLRHIAGFSDLLARQYGRQLPPEAQEYLEQIQNGSARMQCLVDDLLRFSRVGEQGLKWQVSRLDEVVAEVISDLKRDVNGRDVTFDVSPLPAIECDPGLIKQVFWNLLSNALKFTATRQHARIAVGRQRQGNEEVVFVNDNGVGFEMKYADKLFSPFQRLHGDEFEGNGVGLATAQRIVLKHNGRIWAQSRPDAGATFFFTLGSRAPNREEHLPEEAMKVEAGLSDSR